jgi:tetratricopeptide (TPR) repeat protein
MNVKIKGAGNGPFFLYKRLFMAISMEVLIQQLGDALRRNSRAESAHVVKELIRVKLQLGSRWKLIAAVAKKNGEMDDAVQAMKYYCEAVGETVPVQYELAALYAQVGLLSEADSLMAKLPPETPTAKDYYYSTGTLALNLGRVEEARDKLRLACKAAPTSGQSWLALAMAGPVSDADRSKLIAVRSEFKNADALEQSAYYYALGKSLDEMGAYDEAYGFFLQGANAIQNIRPYDHEADLQDAVASIAGWDSVIGTQQDKTQVSVSGPVFVTGLPRSGTTLVEQILNSHSEITGGEELGIMQIVTQDVGKTALDFLNFTSRRNGTSEELRSLYMHLLKQRHSGTGRFVDKSLDTSRYLGMILAIFDGAPIIWLRRDPLDCAWSAYRTWFLRGLEWSWSFEDTAKHFAIEDALFSHWRQKLGDRILVVDYADLVQDPKIQIERITNYCGLAPEVAQLRPHETVRAVKTASVMQVRQPIHTGAVGNSKAYHKYMEPFQNVYREWTSLPLF